jgi:Transglycosylase SLT domain/SPOR domain
MTEPRSVVRATFIAWLAAAVLPATIFLCAEAGAQTNVVAAGHVETTEDSVCRRIETAAQAQKLPVWFLTRLIWQESSFRPDVTSPAGAQGIAQFMPRTAGERGLANPFDPEEAIPKAAELLSDLRQRFGNLGLAAAAYNAGAGRVGNWLAGQGILPNETRNYVLMITHHPVEDWTGDAAAATMTDGPAQPEMTCRQVVAAIRRFQPSEAAGSVLTAPWGVQFAGSHSKSAVLAAYVRVQQTYPAILGNIEPMVLAGRVAGFGWATYYQVRAPAASRAEANALCDKIQRVGGACTVLRN